VLLLLLAPALTRLQAQGIINQIVITNIGPAAVGETLVRANIRSKEGQPYNPNEVNQDVRNLYATGYFSNIRVAEDPSVDGMRLIYYLVGKQKLTDLQFEGNKKFSDRKLRKKTSSKVGEPLDDRKLFNDKLTIIKMYQKSGYPETQVEYNPQPDERAGTATVTFNITESQKVKIDDVIFVGASAYSQRKLRSVLKKTRRHWWLSWLTQNGVLKKDELEDDKDRLAEFYRNDGYIDFELKDIEYDYLTPRKLVLRFIVAEGKQYKVGAVAFKGFTLFTTNEVEKALRMGVGSTFTLRGLNGDREIIRDLYGSKGYIDTRILPRRTANTATGTMDILYEVDEGGKSYIEKIQIRGNTKTKDRVLRRELAVAPGEVFDMTRVKLSERRLDGLNFFETVNAQPEDTDVPERRDLVIAVAEKTTGHFNIGAGFSSVDALIGFVEVTQGNFDLFKPPWFMGGGQKMRLRVQVGTQRQDYLMTFTEPWFLGRKLALTVDLFHRELNYVSANDYYDETRTGGRIGLSRALWSDYVIGNLSYTLENVDIHDVEPDASPIIMAEAGEQLISKVGASIAHDTRNSALLATRGHRIEVRAELAGGPFGADTDYYQGEIRGAQYIPGFAEGHVLELLARTGYTEAYGSSERVPIFDRFFLGGLSTLRGYKYREVGPIDQNEEPIGGNYYWFGSAEYSIPIIERIRFAVFYDIGMAYANLDDYDDIAGAMPENIGNYNDNWGVGLRLNLPIGPLRFDYGIPINDSDGVNDSSGRFQFSAGYNRGF